MALQPYVPAPFGRAGSGARTSQLLQDLAINQYKRGAVQRQQTSGLDQMTRRFGDLRRRIGGSFNQRGMTDSGLHNRAWGRSYGDELRDVGKLFEASGTQRFGLDMGDFSAEGTYATGGMRQVMGDVAARAAKAATIRRAAI